jgi:DegV family protein with EDD domain
MEEKGSGRIAIVTDSTADIPPALIREYGIHVAPQILIMGTRTWRDGVDIDSATFYQLLQASKDFPSTSQPSAADFTEIFAGLARDSDGIAAIVVSDELSGTLNSAQAAAANLPDVPIEVIDSRAVSMQLGYIVLAAARAAAAGGDLQAVAGAARALVGRTHVLFVVDTLEYLHRGGRIGGAARFIGSALNLKPVLEIDNGIVSPLCRVRTRRKALDRVMELLSEQVTPADNVHLAVVHVAAPEEASQFRTELDARFEAVECIESECGPVIGAHVGPGTVAVAYYVEGPNEASGASSRATPNGRIRS